MVYTNAGGIPNLMGLYLSQWRIFIMTTGFVQTSRRWLVALVVAALVVVTLAYGPVLLEQVAGVSVSTPVYACIPTGGGC